MIKQKDFVELEYTGIIKEGNVIFDTTDKETAKKNNIYNEKMAYGPIIICIGQRQLIQGLDDQMIGKEIGKEYSFEIKAEQAFGKKSAKLLKIVPTNVFIKQQIQPMPGLQVNIDGMVGTVRTVTGGRTVVDFNHPLANKDLIYHVKTIKLIEDKAKQIESFISLELGFKPDKVEVADKTAKITISKKLFDAIKSVQQDIVKKIAAVIEGIETIDFLEGKAEENKKQDKTGKDKAVKNSKATENEDKNIEKEDNK